MAYNILPYTANKAKKLGVQIKPSQTKHKKIDVWKHDKFICSIGDIRYGDYPTFIGLYGLKVAEDRRRLYKIRHEKDRHIKGTPGWYADQLLW